MRTDTGAVPLLLSAFFALLLLAAPRVALAHEVRPAYLEATEHANGRVDVLWKQPSLGALAVRLVPHISGGLLDARPSEIQTEPNFQISVWRNLKAGKAGIDGRTITIEGLDRTITDGGCDLAHWTKLGQVMN